MSTCKNSFSVFKVIAIFVCVCLGSSEAQRTQPLADFFKILETLPEPEVFLSLLFNSTTTNVFTIANDFEFCHVDTKDIRFIFYPKHESGTIRLSADTYQKINPSLPIKIIIHGWFGNGEEDYIRSMAEKYNKLGEFNVIGVDWSKHSKKDYIQASCSSRDIAKAVASFVIKVTKGNNNLLKNVHIIGHSLGAQVAGLVGKEIANKTGAKIGRITALDAAAPLFEYPVKMPKEQRVHRDDALFVDGVHTNTGFLGFAAPFGTADYYIGSGGPILPGCANINVFESVFCSHNRSHDLFEKSIDSEKFLAVKCTNTIAFFAALCENNKRVIFGEHTPTNTTGSYFLNANTMIDSN